MNSSRIHKAGALCILAVSLLGIFSNSVLIMFSGGNFLQNDLINLSIVTISFVIALFCYCFENKATLILILAMYYGFGGLMIVSNDMRSIIGEFIVFAGFFIIFRSKDRKVSFPVAFFTLAYTLVLKMLNAFNGHNVVIGLVYFLLVLIGFTFIIYIDTQFIDHNQSQADVYKNLLKQEKKAFARGRQIISVNAGLSGVVQIPDYIALLKRAYNDGERERVNDLIECLEIATKENARRVHAIRNFILTTNNNDLIKIEINSFIENIIHLIQIEGKLLIGNISTELKARKYAFCNPNVLRSLIENLLEPAVNSDTQLQLSTFDTEKGCCIRIYYSPDESNKYIPVIPDVLQNTMESQGSKFVFDKDDAGRLLMQLPEKVNQTAVYS